MTSDGVATVVYVEADFTFDYRGLRDGTHTEYICRDPNAPGKCRRLYNDFCHQPCAVCGLTLPKLRVPGRVMVAHHRNPSEKRHSPSELSRRGNQWWDVLLVELRKCEPLCATCHAAVHDIRRNEDSDRYNWSWQKVVNAVRSDRSRWTFA